MSVNEELARELRKPVSKNSEEEMRVKDNKWAADLAATGSLSSKNRNVICYGYCINKNNKYYSNKYYEYYANKF